MAEKELTAHQRRVLDEVEASLAEAIAVGRRRLNEAGLIPDTGAHFECLICGCDHFEGDAPGKCTECGHSFSSHNIPQ